MAAHLSRELHEPTLRWQNAPLACTCRVVCASVGFLPLTLLCFSCGLQMRKAAERRLLVMVNAHRTVASAWPGDGLWFDSDINEPAAISSWTSFAKQFCTHWNFFAADIVNEPRMASWGRGRPTDWNKAAERIGNAVLGVCPRLLIFVQGIAGDPGAPGDGGVDAGYFWGENLYGVHSAPVQLVDQSSSSRELIFLVFYGS